MSSTITALTSGGGLAMAGDTSGQLQLLTNNGTAAVTVDTSQNVGIGTTSPAQKLDVVGVIQTLGTLQSSSGADLTLNANGANRDVFLKVNGTTIATAVGSTSNFAFNSGYGSVATAYGCRAWVSFVGSTGARYGSGNVSSVTRNGTGDYTVNFTTALVDANYANTVSVAPEYGAALLIANIDAGTTGLTESAPTTTSFRFVVAQYTGTRTDSKYISVAVFR